MAFPLWRSFYFHEWIWISRWPVVTALGGPLSPPIQMRLLHLNCPVWRISGRIQANIWHPTRLSPNLRKFSRTSWAKKWPTEKPTTCSMPMCNSSPCWRILIARMWHRKTKYCWRTGLANLQAPSGCQLNCRTYGTHLDRNTEQTIRSLVSLRNNCHLRCKEYRWERALSQRELRQQDRREKTGSRSCFQGLLASFSPHPEQTFRDY